MQVAAEIAVAAILQIGTLIWLLSGMKADVRNLTGWVRSIDERGAETARLASELKGRLDAHHGN